MTLRTWAQDTAWRALTCLLPSFLPLPPLRIFLRGTLAHAQCLWLGVDRLVHLCQHGHDVGHGAQAARRAGIGGQERLEMEAGEGGG